MSALGTRSATRICATRNSTLAKSSIVMCCGPCSCGTAVLRLACAQPAQPALPPQLATQPAPRDVRSSLSPAAGATAFAADAAACAAAGFYLRRSRFRRLRGAASSLPQLRFAARSFHRRPAVFVFKALHTFNRFLLRARKQRRRLAKLRPRLQSAPREILQKSVLRRIRQSRPAQAAATPSPPRPAQSDTPAP